MVSFNGQRVPRHGSPGLPWALEGQGPKVLRSQFGTFLADFWGRRFSIHTLMQFCVDFGSQNGNKIDPNLIHIWVRLQLHRHSELLEWQVDVPLNF